MLKNVRVGLKLVIGFSLVAILALVVGLVGVQELARIRDSADQVTSMTVPQLVQLNLYGGFFRDLRRLQAGKMIAKQDKNEALVADYTRQMDAVDKTYADTKEAFDKVRRSPETDAIWKDLVKNAEKFRAASDAVDKLIDQNRTQEASVDFLGEAQTRFVVGNELLGKLAVNVESTAKERDAEILATYRAARMKLLATVVIALILVVMLGLFISRSLTVPIAEVSARAERLQSVCINGLEKGLSAMARGDLSVHVEASTKHLKYDRTDEIGTMAKAVDNIISKAQASIASFTNLQVIVRQLVADTETLSSAAKDGALDTRGDAKKFEGSSHDLVQGFNATLDSVLDPINDAAGVLARVVERDLTARVAGEYEGDHAKLKTALDAAVDNVQQTLPDDPTTTQSAPSRPERMQKPLYAELWICGADDRGEASASPDGSRSGGSALTHARWVVAAMLAAALPLSAQITITGDAGLNSQYQWRGITTTNRPVVQPDFIVTAPVGRLSVTAGVWASVEGGRYNDANRHISENGGSRAGLAEYDLWLEALLPVRRVTITTGALTYAYPNSAGTTSASNTLEAYAKAKVDAPFAPQIAVWYDVQKVKGAYAEVSVGRSAGAYAFGALAGWNFGQSVGDGGTLGYFTRHGFTHADLFVSRSWPVGVLSVAPAVHVIVGGDAATWHASPVRDARTKIWFGSTLTWTRTLARQATNAGAGGAAASAQVSAVR